MTLEWNAGNQNIYLSQKKRNTLSLHICYSKVIEGKVSLSNPLGTAQLFGYFDGLLRKRGKSIAQILSNVDLSRPSKYPKNEPLMHGISVPYRADKLICQSIAFK